MPSEQVRVWQRQWVVVAHVFVASSLYVKLGPVSLLFLDIDGVLHPVAAPDRALLFKLPLLEGWLRTRPDMHVVVSSS